jgi:hypothetical protein
LGELGALYIREPEKKWRKIKPVSLALTAYLAEWRALAALWCTDIFHLGRIFFRGLDKMDGDDDRGLIYKRFT